MNGDNESHEAAKFSFPGRGQFFAIYSGFVFICLASFVDAAVSHQLTFPLFGVLALFLCVLGIAGPAYALRSAEMLVDDAGISRILLGRSCQSILWKDVKNIQAERMSNPRVSVVVIRIIGKRGKLWGFNVATTMSMSDRYDRFEQLVDILNEYVAINYIPVEVKINDIWQRESKIRYSIEERNIYL